MTPRNLLLWMLIVTLSLTSCTMIQPPTSVPLPTLVALPTPTVVKLTPQEPVSPNEPSSPPEALVPWITDEVTLFGAKEDIRNLLLALPNDVRALFTDPDNPQPEAEFDLTLLVAELLDRQPPDEGERELFSGFFGGRPLQEQVDQRIVAQRYRFIARENDILNFIANVDEIRGEPIVDGSLAFFKYFVFAEPNFWLTSVQASQDCVSLSAQPNSFGNGPFGAPVPSKGEGAEFDKQWAFQVTAGLPVSSSQSDPLTPATTERQDSVNVAIFDSSPYLDVSGEFTNMSQAELRTVQLSPTQAMTIHVLHFPLGNQAEPPSVPGMEEHGVFIASLVHKVAPKSNLYLVRVLDAAGCGAAYTLNYALAEFTKNFSTGQKIVYNLSLGIPRGKIEAFPRMYLEILLTNALDSKGIIVVAAAGNNYAQPLLLPAGYVDDLAYSPYVRIVAVEASNQSGVRACFSNKGLNENGGIHSDHAVLAPGGEGQPMPAPTPCLPVLTSCENKPTCADGIMGLTHDSRYVFWSGTSFAAPLVSGASARWLAQGCSPSRVINYFNSSNPSIINLTSLGCP